MCRLAAYTGPSRVLADIVIAPPHSLLRQSIAATEAKLAVNGDGFGMAWWGEDAEPGLYRDVLPAWSDGNLPSLCRVIRSHMLLAHVRAGTDGETARVNCHPFTHGRWAFMHNGRIGGFNGLRRTIESDLPDAQYLARRGTTDSELFFLCMVAAGLEQDPVGAFLRTYGRFASLSPGPLRFAVVLGDGRSLWAFRASSDGQSPSLYLRRIPGVGGTIVASEPLDGAPEGWESLPPQSVCVVTGAEAHISPLALGQDQTCAA